jgi:hypothetical protein
MSRLVAFGCSNTYGEGLDDCWVNNDAGPTPSKFAWPQVLANDLNLECVNLSVPGTSNKQICNDILNTDFKLTDIVVIMWTFFSRTCFFQDQERSKRITVQDITNKNFDRSIQKYNNTYYKTFYTQTNSNIESYMYINLIQLMLKEKEISNYHVRCNQTQGKLIFDDSPPDWSQTDIHDITNDNIYYDKALDGMHPGLKSHRATSKIIKKHIKGKSK